MATRARMIRLREPLLALCALGALGASAPRHAAAQEEAWHFESDASRHVRVDDRGGLGEGYSFSIEYDATDGNSEDFCPHCRFSVVVSDPGLDMSVLERLGIAAGDLGTGIGFVSTLQSVASADPTGLAMMLEPGLTGSDLTVFVAEVTALQATVVSVLNRLEMIAAMQAGSFAWTGADVETVVEALALQQDSAFRGDFSDINDPRIHNSGVAVYTLPEMIAGLAGQGVPMSTQTAIESALSSVPGLTGSLEISGDDSSVVDPVSFHGYHTNLTVRLRTYAVNGFSAYLLVYTLVNDTQRVLPFVETAMIADFDIPPLSYDTSTDYDAATSTVMVYDQIPYTMPEQHYWFGLAPASIVASPVAAPGRFGLAHWNIDQNMTLAQSAPSIHLNRYRFFLGDPAITGDHDVAMGKSEKQGAISMLLEGPMLPGDERSVAFCYAAGEGGSSGPARAEMTAMMTACRALYTALSPSCGDGVLGYGEECEGGLAAGCGEDCKRLVCGDGRTTGTEECDDGNTTAADGCSDLCVREICGNGVVQAGEECDDGNASNTDTCLNDCHAASCGDGFVRACAAVGGGECGGCAGHQVCMRGTFTLDTFAPTTGLFDTLDGTEIEYLFAFDVVSTTSTGTTTYPRARVVTGPVHVELSGDPFAAGTLAAAFGPTATWTIDVGGDPTVRGATAITTSVLPGMLPRTTTPIGLQIRAPFSGATYSLGRTGIPLLTSVRMTAASAIFTSRSAGGALTDSGSGPSAGSIRVTVAGVAGEACDDGNESDFDACTTACEPAECGDGLLQVGAGEECDEGASPPAWCVSCRRAMIDLCGNGTIEAAIGEICDDGNDADGDGCSALCLMERCGDGIAQASEECDDGANGDDDGCTDTCVLETCGDGIVQSREACDTGAMVADTAACLASCQPAACGDGFVLAGVEDCDDGNLVEADGCNADCAIERCGDGLPGPDEQCDDANANEADGCSPTCALEFCGDGMPGPDEQCDDMNSVDGDGCDKDCQLENLAACGDGNVGAGEQCDDGGNAAGDGCNELCQLDDPAACGNGTVDPGEGCDDGNAIAGDGCTPVCTEERCGDAVHASAEACDDGNTVDGDGCSATCEAEPSACGNGTQEYGEQCDDGNVADGDACTSECAIDPPGSAPLGETCGNGTQDLGEQCDDGGRLDGNGCDGTCQLEGVICGNGRLDYAETCEDGNAEDGDGCSAMCTFEGEPPMRPMPPASPGCSGCAAPGRASSSTLGWLGLAVLGLITLARRRR